MVKRGEGLFLVIAGAIVALGLAACSDMPATPERSASATPAVFIGASVGETWLDAATGGGRIDFLVPDGPAEAAGLREGDVMISAGGQAVRSNADLIAALKDAGPGVAVPIAILRAGQPMTVEVKPEARPPDFEARVQQAMVDRIRSEDEAAARDQAAGAYRRAFDHDVEALRLIGLAHYGMADARQSFDRDLGQVASLLPRINPAPGVPPDAERFSNRAIGILSYAHSDADNDAAAQAFALAIYAAPWVADLYRDDGLVLAKAGDVHGGSVDLKRYLMLSPDADDAAAIRQKIADLEQVAAEEGPAVRFVGTQPLVDGQKERLMLRGHELVVSLVTPPAPPDPESRLQPGDTICAGTVNGSQFQGHCVFVSADPRFLACFGDRRDVPANGTIDGKTFRIESVVYMHYHSESCVIDEERRGEFRKYRILD